MSESTRQPEEILADLTARFGAPVLELADEKLLAEAAVLERIARVVTSAQMRVAGEIAARSRPERGEEGLSRSRNFSSPAKLLAAVTGVSTREARARLDLGARLRGAVLLGGGVGPDPFPLVSQAMERGELGAECATAITRECGDLERRGVDAATLAAAEEQLVAASADPLLTTDDVTRLAVRIRQLLDPDGLEPRAEAQYEARSLTLSRSSDGMFRGRIALDPEAGALWIGALQSLLSPRTRPRFVDSRQPESEPDTEPRPCDEHPPGAEAAASDGWGERLVAADTRTTPQKMADAATELITRATTAPDMPHLAGATTTVNVHVTLADLEAGRGAAWIDGVEEPLPVSAVQRLRCASPTAVTVFGERGEILHHGKTQRLFSPAQNRALAARDGGCVWPGCDRPPSWCESHHVEEWTSATYVPGRTDVVNGVLLCHFHHRRLHKQTWRLVMLAGVPHIIPPPWKDPAQTPVPVTRRRTLPPCARRKPAATAPPHHPRR